MITKLKAKITQNIKDAMRAKDTTKLETTRSINGAIVNFEKANPGKPVDVAKVLKQLESQRKQAIEAFILGGAIDQAEQENKELAIIEEYITEFLPKQLTEEEIHTAIKTIATENNFGVKDIGKIMGELKKKFGSAIDMQKASAIVKSSL